MFDNALQTFGDTLQTFGQTCQTFGLQNKRLPNVGRFKVPPSDVHGLKFAITFTATAMSRVRGDGSNAGWMSLCPNVTGRGDLSKFGEFLTILHRAS